MYDGKFIFFRTTFGFDVDFDDFAKFLDFIILRIFAVKTKQPLEIFIIILMRSKVIVLFLD